MAEADVVCVAGRRGRSCGRGMLWHCPVTEYIPRTRERVITGWARLYRVSAGTSVSASRHQPCQPGD